MTTLALREPRSFWEFDGTAEGASKAAELVPSRRVRWLLGLVDGSATGTAYFAGPVQTIYAAQRESAKPNWNADGALPIPEQAAHWARRLFLSLPSYLPVPDVYGDPTGAIAFEWYRKPKHRLVLSVYGSGRIEFAGLWGVDDEVYGAVRMGSGLPKVIRDYLRHLYPEETQTRISNLTGRAPIRVFI